MCSGRFQTKWLAVHRDVRVAKFLRIFLGLSTRKVSIVLVLVGDGSERRPRSVRRHSKMNRDQRRHSEAQVRSKKQNIQTAQAMYWTRVTTNRGVDEAGLVTVLIVDELDIDDLDTSLLFHGRLNFLAKFDGVLVIRQAGREGKHKLVSDRDSLVADEAPRVLW